MEAAALGRLPDRARTKMRRLLDAAEEADTLARAAQRRIGELQNSLNGGPGGANAAALKAEIARVTETVGQHAERYRHRAQVVAQLETYILGLPQDAKLYDAPPTTVKIPAGEHRLHAVAKVRMEIANQQAALENVRRAALPVEDQKEAARAYVQRLADRAKPTLSMKDGGLDFNIETGSYTGQPNWQVLLALFNREQFVAYLEGQIDARPKAALVLSNEKKAKRTTALRADIERLERIEDAHIEAAAIEDSLEIPRRTRADPRAVLGVVLAKDTAKRVAAKEAAE